MEREVSVSRSKSRQFRHRNEPKNAFSTNQNNVNEPPLIHDYDSDDSDDVEIPGLKEIIFSDDGDIDGMDEDDGDDDGKLIMMELLVQQENDRLAREIYRM